MTPTDLHPIIQQATRHRAAGWNWCLLRPAQVLELADICTALQDAQQRLEQIKALADKVLYDCAPCYRENERRRVHEIARLAGDVIGHREQKAS